MEIKYKARTIIANKRIRGLSYPDGQAESLYRENVVFKRLYLRKAIVDVSFSAMFVAKKYQMIPELVRFDENNLMVMSDEWVVKVARTLEAIIRGSGSYQSAYGILISEPYSFQTLDAVISKVSGNQDFIDDLKNLVSFKAGELMDLELSGEKMRFSP